MLVIEAREVSFRQPTAQLVRVRAGLPDLNAAQARAPRWHASHQQTGKELRGEHLLPQFTVHRCPDCGRPQNVQQDMPGKTCEPLFPTLQSRNLSCKTCNKTRLMNVLFSPGIIFFWMKCFTKCYFYFFTTFFFITKTSFCFKSFRFTEKLSGGYRDPP